MRKTILVLGTLLTVFAAGAQEGTWSSDVELGMNNPVTPYASGYDAASLGNFHVGLGGRYMFTNKFGLHLGVNYDQFGERRDTPEFKTGYFRVSLEGVADFGKMVDIDGPFTIMMHAGGGYSVMSHVDYDKNDNMINFTAGITPTYTINDNCAVYLDFTGVAHSYQSRTYDFKNRVNKQGLDGYLYNLSVGFRYTLQ